jgi:V8-like Glu-specific endopeptidase
MTHFLDELSYPFWNPAARELRDLLVKVYNTSPAAHGIASQTDMELAVINFAQAPFDLWNAILDAAARQGSGRALIAAVLEDKKARGCHARVKELIGPAPALEPPGSEGGGGDDGNHELQIEPLPTLLDIAFLEGGLRVAKAVVRLTTKLPSGRATGTGFMIAPDLVLTNHHVLYDWSRDNAPASWVKVDFGYENDENEDLRDFETCTGDPASIAGEKEDDWAVVRLSALPVRTPYITLPLTGAPPVEEDNRVYIIQHPKGGAKQIGLHHNDVRLVNDKVIHYRTDTESGSSGAPVFDERWRVVALHHRWVEVGQAQSRRVFRNEGVVIGRVVAGLSRFGIAHDEARA